MIPVWDKSWRHPGERDWQTYRGELWLTGHNRRTSGSWYLVQQNLIVNFVFPVNMVLLDGGFRSYRLIGSIIIIIKKKKKDLVSDFKTDVSRPTIQRVSWWAVRPPRPQGSPRSPPASVVPFGEWPPLSLASSRSRFLSLFFPSPPFVIVLLSDGWKTKWKQSIVQIFVFRSADYYYLVFDTHLRLVSAA